MVIVWSLILLLILPAQSYAAKPSASGLSGLPFMTTTDVAAKGELDVFFRAGVDKYKQAGLVDNVGRSALGISYGLIKDLEVAAQIPHSYKEGVGYSGVPYFTVAAKYRFLGGRDKFYAMAISAVGNVGASDIENNIGSGESGYSIELNTSLYGGSRVKWHLMLGREKSDRKLLAVSATTFDSVVKNKVGLGVEYAFNPDLYLSLEAEGTVTTEDKDDNGLLSLGLRYQADTALSYVAGIGAGLPDERSQPQIRAFVGIAYSFGKPNAPTRAATSTTVKTASPVVVQQPAKPTTTYVPPPVPRPGYVIRDGVEVRADIYDLPETTVLTRPPPKQAKKQPAKSQPKKTQPSPKAIPAQKMVIDKNIRIDVWNASGIEGLGEKVADRLKKKGYQVVRVKVSKRRQKQSVVFYKPGYSKQAVMVGHSVWKNQEVQGTDKLREGIEVQFVVGYDLKQ